MHGPDPAQWTVDGHNGWWTTCKDMVDSKWDCSQSRNPRGHFPRQLEYGLERTRVCVLILEGESSVGTVYQRVLSLFIQLWLFRPHEKIE